MASPAAGPFKLSVLNPAGRDPEQYFETEIKPDSGGHPPINFHGFAACTGGAFHRDVKDALAEKAPILLLLAGSLVTSTGSGLTRSAAMPSLSRCAFQAC